MKLEIVFKDGRKETFDCVASFNVTEEQTANQEFHASNVAKIPTEGKLFEVNPLGIDRSIFEKPMSDWKQELIRKNIQEAFVEVDKHPEKYASQFYTLIPEKKWDGYKTVPELKAYAYDLGGRIANWVEQVLEWAQRISNGENWEDICNNADTANWYRMVIGKNRHYEIAGGSRYCNSHNAAAYIGYEDCYSEEGAKHTVPLVVIKKK